jgi:hypothetical protein
LEHWIPQLLLLVIMPIGAMELQHSPRCQGHKFSMQNLTVEKTNVDTKSSIILAVCKMLCGTQCADGWCTPHHMGVVAISQLSATPRAKILFSTRVVPISSARE